MCSGRDRRPCPVGGGPSSAGRDRRPACVLHPPRDAHELTAGEPADEGLRTVRIALVNNMPDGAFEETERQFVSLLSGGFAPGTVNLERYTLPGIVRGPRALGLVAPYLRPTGRPLCQPARRPHHQRGRAQAGRPG